jgi:Zn-dependent protease with chaperone function
MNDTTPRPPPTGVILLVVGVAVIAGAVAAQPLYVSGAGAAWLIAGGLCGGLFATGRHLAKRTPTAAGFLGLTGYLLLTVSYLMTLGTVSWPRPASRDVLVLVAHLFIFVGVIGLAIALPVSILLAALRRGREADVTRPGFVPTPALIAFLLGTLGVLVSFVILAIAVATVPRDWRAAATLSVAFVCPVVLPPFWGYAYLRSLSLWKAVAVPQPLLDGLQRLCDRTGFEFHRILCLDGTFDARVCQTVTTPGGSTLVISESVGRDLGPDQLLAVLAHEAAHASLGHFRKKVGWGVLGTALALSIAVAAQLLIAPFVPRSMAFAGVLVAVLPAVVLRHLYDTVVVRRHEAEADAFAVDVAGGAALLEALTGLGGCGPSAAHVHNRWTTHGTWERRASAIRKSSQR